MLPDKYQVRCANKQESQEVIGKIATSGAYLMTSYWPYVVKDDNDTGGYDGFYGKREGIPLYTFSEWKALTGPLPEKWVIKPKDLGEAAFLSEWIKGRRKSDSNLNDRNYSASELITNYFRYPKHQDYMHTSEVIFDPAYKQITIDQLKSQNVETKFSVTGSVPLRRALVEELQEEGLEVDAYIKEGNLDKFTHLIQGSRAVIGVGNYKVGTVYNLPKDYEAAKEAFISWANVTKEVELTVGKPARKIKITREGEITGPQMFKTNMAFVKRLEKSFAGKVIEGVQIASRALWIGCAEGTEIKKEDIDKIIHARLKLNSWYQKSGLYEEVNRMHL